MGLPSAPNTGDPTGDEQPKMNGIDAPPMSMVNRPRLGEFRAYQGLDSRPLCFSKGGLWDTSSWKKSPVPGEAQEYSRF